MPTTSTSDTDPAIGRDLALSRLVRQGRDLFQGEAMALARAGFFGSERGLKKLLADWQAIRHMHAARSTEGEDLVRQLALQWELLRGDYPATASVAGMKVDRDVLRAREDEVRALLKLWEDPRDPAPPRTDDLDLVRRNLRITSKEIQAMAGAKFSGTINNWRRGKQGFPEPVLGGRSPLFNLAEVHAWLKAHDKLVNEPGADWYWRKWVQALSESVVQGGRFLRAYVTSVVFVLRDFRTDKDGWVDRFHDIHTAEGFDQWSAGKDNLEDLADFLRKHLLGVEFRDSESSTRTSMARAFWHAVENDFTERDLLDQALDTLSELTDTQDTTSLPLSDLITRLVADLPGPPSSFLDLASGEATVLANLASRGGLPDLQLSGFELDGDVAAISKIRLGYLDNETAWEIHVRDSLDEGDSRPRGTFDAVLVDPPTKKIPRWINHSAALLNKTTASRAFILLPEAALAVDGPCAGSIKRKRLEAVVLLPNRLKRKSRGLVLCIFTSDQATCEEILVIDLTRKYPDDGTRPPRQIGAVLPADDVCAAISHWRDTRTINAELLPGRQRSIGAEAAAIHDLKDWDLVDLEPHLIHTGEVRASGPEKPLEEGYGAKRAAEITGITYRQLDYWDRTDLVRPSLVQATGSGSRRLYSYRDLLELRAVKSLLDAGIRLQTVQTLDPSTKPLTKPVDVPLELLAKLEELKKLLSIGLTDLDSRKPPE